MVVQVKINGGSLFDRGLQLELLIDHIRIIGDGNGFFPQEFIAHLQGHEPVQARGLSLSGEC